MRRRLTSKRLLPRLLTGILALTLCSAAAIWFLRKPLLRERFARATLLALGESIGGDVTCGSISGDPFGTLRLDDVRTTGARWSQGIALDVASSSIEVDISVAPLLSEAAGSAADRFVWRIAHATLEVTSADRATGDQEQHGAAALQSKSTKLDEVLALAPPSFEVLVDHLMLVIDGHRCSLQDVVITRSPIGLVVKLAEVRSADVACKHVEVEITHAALAEDLKACAAAFRCRAEAIEGPRFVAGHTRADFRLADAELHVDAFEIGGLAATRSGSDSNLRLEGHGRIDLPRGRARRVYRVHWDVLGSVAASLAPALVSACLPRMLPRHNQDALGAARLSSAGSIKLPIASTGGEEEYLAGHAKIDFDGLTLPSIVEGGHIAAEVEIDGSGALIFKRTSLRHGKRQVIAIRGRYPLHKYGRPDLRVDVDIDRVGALWSYIDAPIRERLGDGALRASIRLRGEKRDPQVRVEASFTGTRASAALALKGTAAKIEVDNFECRVRDATWIAFGTLPLAIQPGIEWGETFAKIEASTDLRGLRVVGVAFAGEQCLVHTGRLRPGPRPFYPDFSSTVIGNPCLAARTFKWP